MTLITAAILPVLLLAADRQVAPKNAPPVSVAQPVSNAPQAVAATPAAASAASASPSLQQSAPAAQPSSDVISGRLEVLALRVGELEGLVNNLKMVAAILGVALSVAGFVGYSTSRKWARKAVEASLNKLAKAEVDVRLPIVLESAVEKAEKQILRLAKLLAMRAGKAFDEALEEFGWTGRVTDIRAESPIFRRALIDCLYNARTNQKQNREDAWTAVNELLADDQGLETIRLALKICVSGRRFSDGSAVLERYRSLVDGDKEAAMYAATLLRRQGQLKAALVLADKFRGTGDFQVLVTIAALKREFGLFAEAHDVLLPAVQRITSYSGEYPPAAWFRVLNTYVANCLDRSRPDDAVRSAHYMLRSAHGGVELFTVGRLIHRLSASHPERAELLLAFKAAIPKLLESDARFKCETTLAEIDGRVGDAISGLKREIESIENGPDAKRRQMDIYYHRSHLSQLFLRQSEQRHAIDAVIPATQWEFGGEAKYYLAVGYAMDHRPDDALRWLKEAVNESPRWAAYARDEVRLRDQPGVAEFLAEHTH